MSQLQVTNFSDYRDYIAAAFQDLQNQNKKYSYQYCSRVIGTTRSYLQMLVYKKRHASQDKIMKIAKLFNLNDLEQKYLVFCFFSNTVKDPDLKNYFQDILNHLKTRLNATYRSPQLYNDDGFLTDNSSTHHRVAAHSWLYMAIYELIKLDDFKYDYNWMSERLGGNIESDAIKSVIESMLSVGALTLENNKLIGHDHLRFEKVEGDLGGEDLNAKHKSVLHRTMSAIEDLDKHRAYRLHSGSFALSYKNSSKLIDLFTEFESKILELAKQDQGKENVIMTSMHFYSVTP